MRSILRWLLPGLGFKRWLIVSVVGVFVIGLSFSLVLRGNLYARVELWLFEHVTYSAQFFVVAPWLIALLWLLLGVLLTLVGIIRLVRGVLHTLTGPPTGGRAETYYQRRFLVRGPKVVAVGGGTGSPALLRGIKRFTSNISAIVTVADDGGSSGRLRTEYGILPPGDIRNCLMALADTEPLLEKLFQYRFAQGTGLEGHPFGNLFILAMTETTGNFYDAIRASSQILAVRGNVMPSTLDHVVLTAELATGERLVGESSIGRASSRIKRVRLERVEDSEDGSLGIHPLSDALDALREADLIVLGPGSLYTSILPNLLVPGVAAAIRESKALKIYVCNIMTEPGETDNYSVSEHLKALSDHAGEGIVSLCLVNSQPISEDPLKRYLEQQAAPVAVDIKECERLGVEVIQAVLIDADRTYLRHDPEKLADAIGQLILERCSWLERIPWDFFLLRQHLQKRKREAKG